MKTFGFFVLLLVISVVTNSIFLRSWSTPEIVIQSTLMAYIIQQYLKKK